MSFEGITTDDVYTQVCRNPECGFQNGCHFGDPGDWETSKCPMCNCTDVVWLELSHAAELKQPWQTNKYAETGFGKFLLASRRRFEGMGTPEILRAIGVRMPEEKER